MAGPTRYDNSRNHRRRSGYENRRVIMAMSAARGSGVPQESVAVQGGGADMEPANRLRALSDLATPYAIRVAATLRLADLIHAGARRPDDLAERCGADAAVLERLLR